MAFNKDDFIIRPVKEDECEQIIQMINELADFEEMSGRNENTPNGLRQDIFDEPKRCFCLVVENVENKELGLVGFAIYFPAYSTWQRTFLHLEDLYIKPDFRSKGLGKRLYQAVAQIGIDMGVPKVELDVLEWNKKAKDFYEKVGNVDITEKESWHRMRLQSGQMKKFVQM